MRQKIAQYMVAFSLIVAIGGHWVVLQSVAWMGMVVNYSQDATLSVALQKTFDGEHPCTLCKVVQAGKKTESKQKLLKLDNKLDFWLRPACAQIFPPLPLDYSTPAPVRVTVRLEPPPTPPPRLA